VEAWGTGTEVSSCQQVPEASIQRYFGWGMGTGFQGTKAQGKTPRAQWAELWVSSRAGFWMPEQPLFATRMLLKSSCLQSQARTGSSPSTGLQVDLSAQGRLTWGVAG
jgi:hypothetical protein